MFKINRIYESYKKVMLSNAFTPSFGPYAQLSSVVEPATLPLRR